jgi:antitoxin (DNA-binding transcriptional repressor) of toxin-antitoxin stability system
VGADPRRIQVGYWIERVRAGEDVVVTRRGTPVIRLTAVGPAAAPHPAATTLPASQIATTAPPDPQAATATPLQPGDIGAPPDLFSLASAPRAT